MALPPIPPIVEFPKNWLTLIVFRGLVPRILHFPVMPESFMGLKKYFVTVTPTLDGGFVDDYGFAPSPFTLSGTFGYNTKGLVGQKLYTGFGWLKYLEWLVDESHKPDIVTNVLPEVWLMSWVSDHYYKVVLEDLNVNQSVNRNTLWQYTLKLTALQPLELEIPIIDNIFEAIKERIVSIRTSKSVLSVANKLARIQI